MNDETKRSATPQDNAPRLARAGVRPTRFSVIWLIPILAVIIAGWLAWRSLSSRGPDITVTFDTASGITPGQTQVKNKAVTLGTAYDISLTPDMRRVLVHIRMNAGTESILTNHTRFWVVRPRINGASITGLETLVSGAYIAIDPGEKGGTFQSRFSGLESAPGIRSDQPGATFMLVTPTLGSIGEGAPVFFREKVVGEVLDYTMPPGGEGPFLIQVFVRSPYDRYLRLSSRFWNASGVQVGVGAGGLKVQLSSLQALLSGGVAFGMPPGESEASARTAPANALFRLYGSKVEAENAQFYRRIKVATYLSNSVKGLTKGSQVTLYGIQVGSVTKVALTLDEKSASARVRVEMELEPERFCPKCADDPKSYRDLLAALVRKGMRASTETASFVTGQSVIGLDFVKNSKPEKLAYEGDVTIIPSQAGGISGIMASVSATMDKIAAMPLTQTGEHLDDLLAHVDHRVKSPEVTKSLIALRKSLQHISALSDHADKGMQPFLHRLPEMSRALQGTLVNAKAALARFDSNSDFGRDLRAMIVQLQLTARSVRFLTDYLNHHPSALILGRH